MRHCSSTVRDISADRNTEKQSNKRHCVKTPNYCASSVVLRNIAFLVGGQEAASGALCGSKAIMTGAVSPGSFSSSLRARGWRAGVALALLIAAGGQVGCSLSSPHHEVVSRCPSRAPEVAAADYLQDARPAAA